MAGVWRDAIPAIRRNAEAVADFLGSPPDRTAFVSNATAGLNALINSVPLESGDEILHIDQGYQAVWQTILLAARRRGLDTRRLEMPWPIRDESEILEVFATGIEPRTKLLVLDQITSPTAIRLPVEGIIELCEERGVEVVVDGAHGPGTLERPAAEAANAVGWTGNLHKWPCALRGTAAITVRDDLAGVLRAPVTSHFLDTSFSAEFDWQGTFDPTPWLLAAEAIALMDRFGGWAQAREYNHRLVTDAHRMLCEAFRVDPMSPLDGTLLGSMATVPLPDALQSNDGDADRLINRDVDDRGRIQIPLDPIQRILLEEHRIEVPVLRYRGRRHVRVSAHVYNEPQDYERLAEAIDAIQRRG